MNDPPRDPLPPSESDHTWVHENLAAYLVGGLDSAERARLDAHINSCPACFDDFTEARDADRLLQRTLAPLQPAAPPPVLEDRLLTHFREKTMNRWMHPLARRAAYATAAAVALAATGVFANYAIHQGRLNNPLSETLVAQADQQAPELTTPIDQLAWKLKLPAISPARNAELADIRGIAQSEARYDTEVEAASAATTMPEMKMRFVPGQQPSAALEEGRKVIRSDRVSGLVADAKKLSDASHFKEAEDLLTQATVIDPQNENAHRTLREVQDLMLTRDYERISGSTVQAPRINLQSLAGSQNVQTFGASSDFTPNFTARDKTSDFSNGSLGGNSFGGGGSGGRGTFAQATPGISGVPSASTPPQAIGGTLAYGDAHTYYSQLQQQPAAATYGWSDGAQHSSNVSGGLTKSGAGTLNLGGEISNGNAPQTWNFNGGVLTASGANTYAGETKISGGNLKFSQSAGKPADASGNAAPGATINGGGGNGATALADVDKNGTLRGITVTSDGNTPTNGPAATGGLDLNVKESGKSSDLDSDKPRLQPAQQTSDFDHGGRAADSFGIKSTPAQDEQRDKLGDPQLTLGRRAELEGNPRDIAGKAVTNLYALNIAEQGPAQPVTRPSAAPPAPQTQPAVEQQSALKIIRNGTVAFEVRNFDDAYQTVSQVVAEERGFVSSTSSDKLANGKVRGTIVVRVPPEHLDRFLLKIRALGDLKAQQIAASDVTKDYYDTQSELRGLRTMESRLLDLIKTGKGEVKDLIAAEAKLGETRVQIEKLEGTLNYYNNLVSLATISITVYEKDIQTPTAASEQEVVNLNVETEEVETKYQNARKILDDAKARIVESQLKNADAEHVAAHIVAEVPPNAADFVSNQLKQLGKVSSFNRDRRQTATGGTGQPAPGVQIEKKDTRITIDLYNLANLAPRETTVLRVAVRDVEASYKAVLAMVRKDAPQAVPLPQAPAPASQPAPESLAFSRTVGRVISSSLAGQQPEQMSADIRAELRADQADAILAAIRDPALGGGETLTSSLATNADNAGTTSAKRGLQLQLVSIASVPPKDATTMNIAVADVDAAYKKLLALIRQDVPAPAAPAQSNPLLPPTIGRVLNSNLTGGGGRQPEQMVADIRAEIRTDQFDTVQQALRDTAAGGGGGGEIMNSSNIENPDQVNSTRLKRGLQVRLLSVAAIPARETVSLRTVAADVPDAFNKLVGSLQALVSAGSARIISSQFNQADARNVNAMLAFEVRRDAVAAVEKALTDAGIDGSFSRNIVRSTDTANTLDTKVRFNIDEIKPADSLEPRRTIILGEEVADVEAAVSTLRKSLTGQSFREVDSNISRDASGRQTAHIVLDVPYGKAFDIQNRISDLHGTEKNNQVTLNNNVPEIRLAKERIELTLTSRSAILQSDKGLWQSVRAALSSAAGALLYSLYLVLTGILFILPFILILWPAWILMKRRKAATN